MRQNAELKARTLWTRLKARGAARVVLGDDSGLEIDALGGRPGLYSARYLGEAATWAERRDALLAELVDHENRRARFVCALHLIDERGTSVAVEASYEGSIVRAERGVRGFSYDPIFLDPTSGLTFGELSDEEKNARSHRALAFAALNRRLSG